MKVTMDGIECDEALLTSFQEGSHQKLVFQEKTSNSASKLANWIIVDISSIFFNLMLSLANS